MSGESWDPNRVYECSGEPEMTHIEVLFSLEQYRALDKLLVELGQGIEQYILPSESRECCYVSEWEDVPDTEVLEAQVNALLGEPDTRAAGECYDCGDPAPVGLYQCEPCHRRERKQEGPS